MPPTEGDSGAPKEIQVFATKYCRMCAMELRNGVFIFGEEGKRLHIPEKIRKTLAILVLEEDTLPKKICTDCCSSLEDYAQYKDTVLDAQEKLASIAKNLQNTQHEISELVRSHQSAIIQFSPTPRKSPKKPEHEHHPSFSQITDGTPSSTLSSLAVSQLEYPSTSKPKPKHLNSNNEEHSRNIPIKCGFCPASGEIFSERQTVLAHISKSHVDLRHKLPRFRCSECPKITEKYNALRVHAYKHQLVTGGHVCPESHCNKTYPLKSMLDAHRTSKHSRNTSSEKTFSCKECGKRFHTKTGLAVHITTKHVDDVAKSQGPPELIPDTLSDSSLPEPDYIDDDDDDITDDPSFSMGVHPDRQRCVTINGQTIENQTDSHKLVCKLPVFVNTTNEDKDYDREMQQFKKFPFPAVPECHSEETKNKQPENKIKSKVWNCSVCDKMLTSNTGYHNHMMVHKGRKFDCDQCGVSYMQKATLLHHKKVHHIQNIQKKHKCSICSKEFHELKFLTQHMKIHGDPSSEFRCNICQKIYKTGRCLRRHVKLHTSSKKYICSMCNKGFRVKSKLDEHENSHTGRRPLGCQFCEKAFNGHPNYVKHMRRKHPNEINRDNKIPPPKKSEGKTSAAEQMLHPMDSSPLIQSSSSSASGANNAVPNPNTSIPLTSNSGTMPTQTVHVPVPAHNSDFQHQHQHHIGHNHNHSSQHQLANSGNNSVYTTTNLPGKNYLNPSGGGSNMNSSAMNALDLVDCAIQSALVGESAPNNSSASSNNNSSSNTSTGNNSNIYVNSIIHSQSEPMELSYKLESSAFQDMPMELTKVFQRDPLELCVRQDLNQLMDLSSRVDTNGIVGMSMNLAGVGVHKLDLTERELMDLSGAFRQPIDLIARTDDTPHDLYNEGSLVDLSLRSTFGQDQSASSFLRELIDLSSRSDSFHGELDLTKPHGHHPQQHGNGNSHSSQTHHSSSTVTNTSSGNSANSNVSPKNNGTGTNSNNHVGTSLQNVVYQDAMFSLQN